MTPYGSPILKYRLNIFHRALCPSVRLSVWSHRLSVVTPSRSSFLRSACAYLSVYRYVCLSGFLSVRLSMRSHRLSAVPPYRFSSVPPARIPFRPLFVLSVFCRSVRPTSALRSPCSFLIPFSRLFVSSCPPSRLFVISSVRPPICPSFCSSRPVRGPVCSSFRRLSVVAPARSSFPPSVCSSRPVRCPVCSSFRRLPVLCLFIIPSVRLPVCPSVSSSSCLPFRLLVFPSSARVLRLFSAFSSITHFVSVFSCSFLCPSACASPRCPVHPSYFRDLSLHRSCMGEGYRCGSNLMRGQIPH